MTRNKKLLYCILGSFLLVLNKTSYFTMQGWAF